MRRTTAHPPPKKNNTNKKQYIYVILRYLLLGLWNIILWWAAGVRRPARQERISGKIAPLEQKPCYSTNLGEKTLYTQQNKHHPRRESVAPEAPLLATALLPRVAMLWSSLGATATRHALQPSAGTTRTPGSVVAQDNAQETSPDLDIPPSPPKHTRRRFNVCGR